MMADLIIADMSHLDIVFGNWVSEELFCRVEFEKSLDDAWIQKQKHKWKVVQSN